MIGRLSLRSEGGIAVPVVMGTMVVLSLLAAALLSTAVRSSSNAVGDGNTKRALGAAEAGLQTAALRLKKLNPATNMCMTAPGQPGADPTTGAVAPTPAVIDGACPASTAEPAGTGATFSYRVTPAAATCGRLPGYTVTLNDRCITSVGLANGVKRRIQARVQFGPSFPFAKAGIAGTESVTLTNKVTIKNTDVGSNGPIALTGTSTLPVAITGAAAKPYPPGPPGGVVTQSGTTSISGGIVNSTAQYGLVQPDFAASKTTNNNSLLSTSYYTAGAGSVTRSLSIPANTTYLMPAGTYNLCSWTMAPGSKIDMVNSSAKAKIYLDSPRRPGSGCATTGSNRGQFKAVGNSSDEIKMNNGRFDSNIWVWVYGTKAAPAANDTSAEDIVMSNKAHIDAVWYAPDSIFHATNDVTMHGGVVARHVKMDINVSAELDVAVQQEVGPGGGLVSRQAWFECSKEPTVATDPESGC